jgi:hypothetical protein
MGYDASPVLAGLKSFQQQTVEHVARRFYEDDPPARRFLVADETGLGKSMVARGVIARAIEHLQHDASVDRIDVIYLCSNADIAEQNLQRLDVLNVGTQHRRTRLTLLAQDSGQLEGAPHPAVGKRVNLVSFTPGTSFDISEGTGQARERALLHVILTDQLGYRSRSEIKAAAVVLKSWKGLDPFEYEIQRTRAALNDDGLDGAITEPFLKRAELVGLLQQFDDEVQALGRRWNATDEEFARHQVLIGRFRQLLAEAGIDALEPDLVILDEFQRFRHLLPTPGGKRSEAAELAEALFEHGDAKVLLLSATPFKAFTYAEEATAGDDHEADLHKTLGFLAGADETVVDAVVADLALFREAAINGHDIEALRVRLREQLTGLMCRTERPTLGDGHGPERETDDGMLQEVDTPAAPVTEGDLVAFAALRSLAEAVDAPLALDYWKSTPYFVNFGDGYRLGGKLRAALDDPIEVERLRPHLERTQHLDREPVEQHKHLDPGNARMRRLVDDTVGSGWWKLLWVPPSLPYHEPGGPFAEPSLRSMTKRLIFSSWASTPTAIAALLSHESSRRLAPTRDELTSTSPRLGWRTTRSNPAAMTTLALFWPSPALASSVEGSRVESAQDRPLPTRASGSEPWYWTTLFAQGGAFPGGLSVEQAADALSGPLAGSQDEEHGNLRLHVQLAADLHTGVVAPDAERRTAAPDDLAAVLRELAQFAPGNVAFRCVRRIAANSDAVTPAGLWSAAATLANGLHSLFNRSESIRILDVVLPNAVYWRALLRYCRWGNLEAVLDEYLHHLSTTERQGEVDDAALLRIARNARAAITMLPSRYSAFDPLGQETISFPSRLALRFGNKRASEDEGARQPEVRAAFNSPFWPFILATTSVGQEGIDFHWWCHAAVHWNVPASPVDFEQREGRVHRYGGHAIRRNLAERHGEGMRDALEGTEHPWEAAYRLGAASDEDTFGDLAPFWITTGSTCIQRHVLPYPLSQDHDRYRRLKEDLAVYRLTFGQPRQEDLAELLTARGVHLDPDELRKLRLDLSPPRASP